MKSLSHKRNSRFQPPPAEPDECWRKNPLLIREFLKRQADFRRLGEEISFILECRLKKAGIAFDRITSRAKSLESFLKKIRRWGYTEPFAQMTDLAGVRIVHYYLSDKDAIRRIIFAEFQVHSDEDKDHWQDLARFGYKARHFQVELRNEMIGPRYDELKSLKCEIQARTAHEDAWAVIHHHLAYKKKPIPQQAKRGLSSLAAAAQTNDEQLEAVRAVVEADRFLDDELTTEAFLAYLGNKCPDRPLQRADDAVRIVHDILIESGFRTARAIEKALKGISPDGAPEGFPAAVAILWTLYRQSRKLILTPEIKDLLKSARPKR